VTTGFAERVEGAKLDHAICLVGVNQFGISGLDFFATPGIAQQYAVVERLRGLLYAADDAGEEYIGNHRDQHHEVACFARAELHGHQIRAIAGLFDCRVHPVAGLRRNPFGRLQCA